MNPRFSIIVPLYNKAPYVRKAIETIVAQTYKEWELIVVNDGSTDGSADVVRDFIRANDGMRKQNESLALNEPLRSMSRTDVLNDGISKQNEPLSLNDGKMRLITQANAGVAAARNNGVKASKGEYLCFLDADDWWEPTFLEEMDKLIKAYPDAGLYATNFVYYKPGKTHVEHQCLRTGYINYPEVYYKTGSMPVWTGAACMPRKVFDEMGGFPEGIKLGEDFLLWAKTAVHYNVAFCEKPLAYYNNDVPASLRATRNLHEPKRHMLFNLESLESEIRLNGENGVNDANGDDWKALLDWLRVNGLMAYWMDKTYHEVAAVELEKVDWSKQPRSAKAQYEKPIWLLKAKRKFMQIGSYCKQMIIKILY